MSLREAPRRAAVMAMAGAFSAVAGSAVAQEYCVSCTAPEATYRCVIDVARPPGMPLKLLCVTTLAREGGHATCAVKGGTVFDCAGEVRRVTAATSVPQHPGAATTVERADPPGTTPGGLSAGSPVAGAAPADPSTPTAAIIPPDTAPATGVVATPPPKPERKGPPGTVVELAKDVGASSGKALKKTGDAIADTTQKAWNCVTSLFTSCR